MYLVYLDESHDEHNYVISALLIHETKWNNAFEHVKNFRKVLLTKYKIPLSRELHARDLAAGRGWLRPIGKIKRSKDLTKHERAIVFKEFMECIGQLHNYDVKCINACIPTKKGDAASIAVDRVLNRIQTFCKKNSTNNKEYALLIFDSGNEKFYRNIYRQKRVYNPIPSKYGSWGNEGYTKNITIKNIVADVFFKESKSDYFIQVVDFIAFTLLKKEDPSPPNWAIKSGVVNHFDNYLGNILVREASDKDLQGIVRK